MSRFFPQFAAGITITAVVATLLVATAPEPSAAAATGTFTVEGQNTGRLTRISDGSAALNFLASDRVDKLGDLHVRYRERADVDYQALDETTSGSPVAVLAGPLPANFSAAADVVVHAGQSAGFMFRATGTAPNLDGYYLAISPDDDKVTLYTITGGASTIIGQENLTIQPGETHRLQVNVSGNAITVGADGTDFGTLTNTAYNSGQFALRHTASRAAFDNVAISGQVTQSFGPGGLSMGWTVAGSSTWSTVVHNPDRVLGYTNNNGQASVISNVAPTANVDLSADVNIWSGEQAGLLFRWSSQAQAGSGYLVSASTRDERIRVYRTPNGVDWIQIGSAAQYPAAANNEEHRIRVTAVGPDIKVYLDGGSAPIIEVSDSTYTAAGRIGVRLYRGAATFDEIQLNGTTIDNFDIGNPARRWFLPSPWALNTASQDRASFDSSRTGAPVAWRSGNYGDIDLNADVSILDGQEAGLMFRSTGTTGQASGYYVGLFPGDDLVRLFKTPDGAAYPIIAQAAVPGLATNEFRNIRITAQGSRIRVYVDGAPTAIIDATDSSFSSGKVGLRHYQSVAGWDNITLKNGFAEDFNAGGTGWDVQGSTAWTTQPLTPWVTIATSTLTPTVTGPVTDGTASTYTSAYANMRGSGLTLTSKFRVDNSLVRWTFDLQNSGTKNITVGDIQVPMPFNTQYTQSASENYAKRVVRHGTVGGSSSVAYFTRADGAGSILSMTPTTTATAPEYFWRDNSQNNNWEGPYSIYLRSQATQTSIAGTWPFSPTVERLSAGATGAQYGFDFRWADDYEQLREVMANAGLVDAVAVPGMVVPRDLTAKVALRSSTTITSVTADDPNTTISAPVTHNGYNVYDIALGHIGENVISVKQSDGRISYLQFFSTAPFETLIKDHAAFVTSKQQYRTTDKSNWYDGNFGLWHMPSETQANPSNLTGLEAYAVSGSDDPSMATAPAAALVNVVYPNVDQIEAIEYYIREFVDGQLQRTGTEEPYSSGVYGVPSWVENRADCTSTAKYFDDNGNGCDHLWRTYDYTHMIELYWNMYLVRKTYPDLACPGGNCITAAQYLQRAYDTALAYYQVPFAISMGDGYAAHGYTNWAYTTAAFNEDRIPDVFDALRAEGLTREANMLQLNWERKVKHFTYDTGDHPYESEFAYDTTAFQSSYVIAEYGRTRPMSSDVNGWYNKNARQFDFANTNRGNWMSHPSVTPSDFATLMDNQAKANLGARGNIEPTWYSYGADIRAQGNSNFTLNYMAALGGQGLVDYAVDYNGGITSLRAGYGGFTGTLALVNSGAATTNNGGAYPWWGTAGNKGALSWAFSPLENDVTWMNRSQIFRGPWVWDGENEAGFAAAVQMAQTIVVNDPAVGLVAYGGKILPSSGSDTTVEPHDGVRQKVSFLNQTTPVSLSINRDAIRSATYRPGAFTLRLDNAGSSHIVAVGQRGFTSALAGTYAVTVNGTSAGNIELSSAKPSATVTIPTGSNIEVTFTRINGTVSAGPSTPSAPSVAALYSTDFTSTSGWPTTGGWSQYHRDPLPANGSMPALPADDWYQANTTGTVSAAAPTAATMSGNSQVSVDGLTGRGGTISLTVTNASGTTRATLDVAANKVTLSGAGISTTEKSTAIEVNSVYRIRIQSLSGRIKVFVDDMKQPIIDIAGSLAGRGGLEVSNPTTAGARFDNFRVDNLTP